MGKIANIIVVFIAIIILFDEVWGNKHLSRAIKQVV